MGSGTLGNPGPKGGGRPSSHSPRRAGEREKNVLVVAIWRVISGGMRGRDRGEEIICQRGRGRVVLEARYTIRGDNGEIKGLPAAPRPSRGRETITQLSYLWKQPFLMGAFEGIYDVVSYFVREIFRGFFVTIFEGFVAIVISVVVPGLLYGPSKIETSNLDIGFYLFVLSIFAVLDTFFSGVVKKTWLTVGYLFGAGAAALLFVFFLYSTFPEAIYATIGTVIILTCSIAFKSRILWNEAKYGSERFSEWE